MKGMRAVLFPVLMAAGLVVSAFVIVMSLQAAALPTVAPMASTAMVPVSSETLVGQGRALFLAKGCIVCHRNDRVAATRSGGLDFGDVPNLTHVKIDEDYLRRWLHDPKAVKPGTEMPNLNLSDGEVEALVAFLRSE